MDIFSRSVSLHALPRLGTINTEQLWVDIALDPVPVAVPCLEEYRRRHDQWTDKIRIMGLDGGILVDYRLVPGLDLLLDYIHSQAGWARPEVYLVSDLNRKGIHAWSAISAVSRTRPVILLGTELANQLDEVELAFVIAHETGHLLSYTGINQDGVTLSFMIREFVESGRENELEALLPGWSWQELYLRIMANCRAAEARCDRLGLLVCGNIRKAGTALLSVVLNNSDMARKIDLAGYQAIQYPMLSTLPEAEPVSVNAGHPFVPYRIKMLQHFHDGGGLEYFTRLFTR